LNQFRYRTFLDGDEEIINRLYKSITNKERSKKQYTWQWLESPAGQGDIYLIFDKNKDLLIGHHGIMPIRFTNKKQNLIFGKTENTMVLSQYREKILYPRFENKFKKIYEKKYHALFSTFGPKSAIRVRQAIGYRSNYCWKQYILGTTNFYNSNKSMMSSFLKKKLIKSQKKRVDKVNLEGFMTSDQVSKNHFFDYFWDLARINHGISPRRDREDMHWRFWSNPNKKYFTLLQEDTNQKGYVVISIKNNIANLEDYAVLEPNNKNFINLLNNLMDQLKLNNIFLLRIKNTSDEVLIPLDKYFDDKDIFLNKMYKKIFKSKTSFMPRYITKLGSLIVKDENWHITSIITEGI